MNQGTYHSTSVKAALLFATLISLLFLSMFLILTPARTGFEPGKHGNTAAALLGSLSHASMTNYFLGYYAKLEDATGKTTTLFYERRPPPFFVLARQFVLFGNPNLHTKIVRGQRCMLVLVSIILGAIAFFLSLAGVGRLQIIGPLALLCCSPYVNYYKDMFDIDMPAILGFILVWTAILWFLRTKEKLPLYIGSVLAGSLGLGYAIIGTSLVWFAIRSSNQLNSPRGLRRRIRNVFCDPSFVVLLLTSITSLFWILYAAGVQVHLDGGSLHRTAIFDSIQRRLFGDPSLPQNLSTFTSWGNFLPTLTTRFVFGLLPFPLVPPEVHGELINPSQQTLIYVLAFFAIVLVIKKYLTRLPADICEVFLVVTFSGPLWLLLVRHATTFHDYFSLYFLGTWLVTLLAIQRKFFSRIPKTWSTTCGILFILLTYWNGQRIEVQLAEWGVYTEDAEAIASGLKGYQQYAVDGSWETMVPGVKYALPGYFPDKNISVQPNVPRLISTNSNGIGHNLTPENKKLFLYSLNE